MAIFSQQNQAPNPQNLTPGQASRVPSPRYRKRVHKLVYSIYFRIIFSAILIFLLFMTAALIAFQSEQRKKASEDYEKAIPDAEILLPTPEESPTTNWETFQGEEFGFEISYPEGFMLKQTLKNGPRLVLEKEDAEGNYGPEFFSGISIIIDVRENENEITLDDYVVLDINYLHNSCDSCGNVPQKAQISNINDYAARKFSYYSLGLKFTAIILEHPSEKTFIKIVYSSYPDTSDNSLVIDQILSSFQFLEE